MAEQESAVDICRRRTLQVRIRAMAKRWDYAKDEYEEALALAKKDPDAWERLCDQDEAKHGVAKTEVQAAYEEKRLGPAVPYKPVEPELRKCWWARDGEPSNQSK